MAFDSSNFLSSDSSDPVVIANNFSNMSSFFNESYAKFLDRYGNDFPIDQLEFMSQNQIDEQASTWGKKKDCDYGIYVPICQCCFGIIFAVMFVMCGKGGKAEHNSFLPQPWRIVTPALIFFLVMTILSLVNLVIIQEGMSRFCEAFELQLPDVGCDIALNRYMDASFANVTVSPGGLHKTLTSFNYATFGLWLVSLLVLLARIIFVIDFQLVRVTIKSVEYEKANESSFKVVEEEEDVDEDDEQPNGFTSGPSIVKR